LEIRVKWIEGVKFLGESASAHAVVMQGAPGEGEQSVGIRPMEMLLLGLGGCTAYDVVDILRKGRHQIQDCEIRISAERAESVPKIFTKIHLHYVVTGCQLKDAVVERAITLSTTKYCSASAMLEKAATLTHSHEIINLESPSALPHDGEHA